MDKQWSEEIPKKPGFYWFIGDPFSTDDQRIEINFVEIWQISNGVMYVTRGNFMGNKNGLWLPVIFPKMPIGIVVENLKEGT
jgi:hypothetical protein